MKPPVWAFFTAPTVLGQHLRELTTSILSVGIVGSAIYETIAGKGPQAAELTGWAGMIVGVYFGVHVGSKAAENRKKKDL